jgi:3-keto-L-gulonate-6-phosphate decarboxylase
MIYKTLHRRIDNTMAKRKRTNNDLQNITQKNRQYNGQKKKDKQWSTKHYTEGQTIQWLKEKGQTMIYKTLHRRTDNTMAKRKRTNNDLQNITQKAKDFPTFSCSSKNGLCSLSQFKN